MRKDITVVAEPRVTRGKNEARRLRQAGRIPAALYGAYQPAVAVAVDPKEINRILHSYTGHNTIFNLRLDGETTPAMIVDWQYQPLKDTLLHVDLKRIDLNERLRVSIPVLTEGDPKGVKQQGGLLELVTREILVECLPDEIPEHFTMNVTELLIGQNLRAGEVPLTGSMKLLSSPDSVIAHVIALRREEAAAPAVEAAPAPEAAATAEPEVIKKGKKEEEAGEGEAKGKKK
ncbi:MAG: 50S ribosomal protein L25 [Acidobacteria bacterium]|nr:50S ribosomal protein L25 [Acidobacteriota bacterium]